MLLRGIQIDFALFFFKETQKHFFRLVFFYQ